MSFDAQQQAAIAALDSQVEEIRHQAVRRLQELFDEIPVSCLIKALGDESWRVRKAAANLALQSTVRNELLNSLKEAVGEQDNAGLRNSATEVLVQIGAPSIPVVVAMLQNGDQDERKFAADILGEIGLSKASQPLVQALGDEDENVHGAAAEALGRIGEPSCLEHLLASLQQEGLLVQLSCMDALCRLGAQVPVEVLLPLGKIGPLRPHVYNLMALQQDPAVIIGVLDTAIEGLQSRGRKDRSAAAQALNSLSRRLDRQAQIEIKIAITKVANDEFIERIGQLLASTESRDREAAVSVLGWTGREEVVERLVRAASDESLRQSVIEAILAIGPKAGSALGELLHDIGRSEKVLVLELLGHFQVRDSLAWVIEMCLSEEPEVAEAAQRTLGQISDPSILASFVDLIRSGQDTSISGAIASLAILGKQYHDEVVEAVLPLTNSERSLIREAAAEILCAIAKRRDQRMLEQLTSDQSPHVRAMAVRALGRIGQDDVVPRLRMMLADESPDVRTAVAKALGTRSGSESLAALQIALSDSDSQVVAQALNSLGQVGEHQATQAILPFLKHVDLGVALEAVRALNSLGWGEDYEKAHKACEQADSEIVKEILQGCDGWPRKMALKSLAKALDAPKWDLRMLAARKIGELSDSEGMQLLVERMPKETDQLVKETIERVLRLGKAH